MKYIVILGDGMADLPEPSKGNLTPLMAANTPHLDKLAAMGKSGLFKTIPESLHPGSEVANMAVLGYDVEAVFEGRGVLEAASIGVELQPDDLAMRCNLVCVEGDILKNHSAGHIGTEEGAELIAYLNEKLGTDKVRFYPGVSYRHLLVIKGGNKMVKCVPPHDVPEKPFAGLLPEASSPEGEETAALIRQLILDSQKILADHPVNRKRREAGKDPATSVWPWSPGNKPKMQTLQEMYGLGPAAVISAVDLIQGIGVYAGMDVIKVEGATGLYDTNYEGKAQATIDALRDHDFVYLHIEASDEAGHEGDYDLKVKTIEYLDNRVVRFLLEETEKMDESVALSLLPDHPTPWKIRTHTRDAIPFVIYRPGETPDEVTAYTEQAAAKGAYGTVEGNQFMKKFLGIE
ncbi:cofactor-independent phosphoglycerate mutase [Prolixibacter bellariivorans]|uniref:Cofactor-independent phosphoglycerate mutase n=1 Tax=Prolixibacter bellariivorans TaxID=314319 RepID=A0A5M4B147_9BACT|nr:cofactor-independent phosphoglycerate mutase [Prolixibacter bellariivorans]GET33678.1 cofactor-independent phosphoglycerate mutase [Prolixibacter bellariivorans]